MRAYAVAAALGLMALASACPNTVPEFQLEASNGKVYNAKSFVAKPTILVFLKRGCPANPSQTPHLNKLQEQFGDSLQIVGITNGTVDQAKAESERIKAKFPIIADQEMTLIKGFGAKRSFDLTLVATKTESKWPKLWEGLSEPAMTEVVDIIVKHGHSLPKVDLASFAKEAQRGCSF